jgi:hypothetical protein
LFFARGLLSDHRRFERLHERNGIGRRRFGVQIDEIAQMEKTRGTVLAALVLAALRSGLDARLVWLQKRRNLPPSLRRAWPRRHANRLACFSFNVCGSR